MQSKCLRMLFTSNALAYFHRPLCLFTRESFEWKYFFSVFQGSHIHTKSSQCSMQTRTTHKLCFSCEYCAKTKFYQKQKKILLLLLLRPSNIFVEEVYQLIPFLGIKTETDFCLTTTQSSFYAFIVSLLQMNHHRCVKVNKFPTEKYKRSNRKN